MQKLLSSLIKLSVSIGLLVPALSPVMARAGDCGADPVYSKNMTGAPTVGLRMRDVACMEGSKVLTVIPAGTSVQIVAETDGWYKVKYNGFTGWMGASYIEAKGAAKTEAKTEAKTTLPVELGKKSMVGILEKDFKIVEAGNKNLQARLKDKVLLRVQKKGETWYVEKDGSLTQVKMYAKNEFKRLLKDAKKETKTEVKTEKKEVKPTSPAGSISLKAETAPGKVKLTWVANVDASNGFKIVKSTEPNPTYPENSAEYVDTNTRSREWSLPSGKTYHIRVCRYTGSGCDSYSNNVEVTVPAGEEKVVSKTNYTPVSGELTLKVTTLPGAAALEWTKRTTEGFDGYKIVRSTTNADLSYPNDGYIEFLSDRDSQYFIDGTAVPGKTYYYRVCAREKGTVASCGNVVKVVARQR
ncbi:SH3 domain-containing protein [Candidatus Uhrbacteria bacterium]|nr:SH3 domain-containing protein [Candidatus Uhrbacteria bacterium]